jgi:fermentation-respiration switch protein FrsA (DUF1100 family)
MSWRRLLVMLSLSSLLAGCALDQRSVYFQAPWQDGDWAAEWELPLEDVWFRASDGVKLHGWFVPAEGSATTMLWCHGNAGNIIHRLENLAGLHRRGLAVFIFDYRGYGRSEGVPSEPGLYRDALAAYQVLTRQRGIAPERIVVFGRSLGAPVAAQLAATQPVAGVILETPPVSVAEMVKAHYGALPLHLLLSARFDLPARLPHIHAPVLVIHGDRDRVVPFAHGRRVYELANEPKAFYAIPGADHHDTYLVGGEPYFERVLTFIREAVSAAAPAPSPGHG